MARQSHIQITIPDPCAVPWNGMTPVDDDRRHCSSCNKVVTDFSRMSDDELMLYMRHSSGKMCGRFSVEQINRPFQLLPENSTKAKWWRTLFLFPLLIFGKSGKAQVADSVKSLIDTVAVSKTNHLDSVDKKIEVALMKKNSKHRKRRKQKVKIAESITYAGMIMGDICYQPLEQSPITLYEWIGNFPPKLKSLISPHKPYSDLSEHKEEPSKPQPALPSNDPLTGILPDEKKYPWKA